MKSIHYFLLITMIVLGFSMPTTAQFILKDDFSFSGTLTKNHWTVHSGIGTNPLSTTSGLTLNGFIGSEIGNAVLVDNKGGEDANRPFCDSIYTNGAAIYYSFLVNVVDAAKDKTGDYFIHLGNRMTPSTFTLFAARFYAKLTSDTVFFGLSNTSTATYSTTPFQKNTTYQVVVKYSINSAGNDTTSFWVFSISAPATEAAAGIPVLTNATTTGQDVIDAVALRQGSSSTSPQVVVDGIRIATTWSALHANVLTIAEARIDQNTDLIADHSVKKDTMTLFGVITSPNFQTTQTAYFIQDHTAGIEIFSYSVGSTKFAPGDSVVVNGVVAQYRGVVEIIPLTLDSANLRILKKGAVVPTPLKLTVQQILQNPEFYEGMLVAIDTVYKSSGKWPAVGANSSVYINNLPKTDTLQMFLDLDTDIDGTPEPQYPLNVVGIISQYSSSSSVYNNGYEIMPRALSDITPITVVSVDNAMMAVPQYYQLSDNYPNPFNPHTTIAYQLPKISHVQLRVFNTLGQIVAELEQGIKVAGRYLVRWNPTVSSGVYYYQLRTEDFIQTKKMVLVR